MNKLDEIENEIKTASSANVLEVIALSLVEVIKDQQAEIAVLRAENERLNNLTPSKEIDELYHTVDALRAQLREAQDTLAGFQNMLTCSDDEWRELRAKLAEVKNG